MRTPLDAVKTFTRYEKCDKIVDNVNYLCYKFNDSFKLWFGKTDRAKFTVLFVGKIKNSKKWQNVSKNEFNAFSLSNFCWEAYEKLNDIVTEYGEEEIISVED